MWWGDWHTGQLAADDRTFFGELPSETIKRQIRSGYVKACNSYVLMVGAAFACIPLSFVRGQPRFTFSPGKFYRGWKAAPTI